MESVARVTEISCQSSESFEDAVQLGIRRASKTLRNITSAWVKEMRVQVEEGAIRAFQVNLMVTFVLDVGDAREAAESNHAMADA